MAAQPWDYLIQISPSGTAYRHRTGRDAAGECSAADVVTELNRKRHTPWLFWPLTKRVVLHYELTGPAAEAWTELLAAHEELASAARAWYIQGQNKLMDPGARKRQAGAGHVVQRVWLQATRQPPPLTRTNVEIPALLWRQEAVYFLPDQLLVYGPKGCHGAAYRGSAVTAHNQRFIEEEDVPGDSQVVDHTWKYVNQSGAPDKRFKDNRQLPVVLYSELTLASPGGPIAVLQLSRPGLGPRLHQALVQLANALASSPSPAARSGV